MYKKGDFGYWWVEILNNIDIKDTEFTGDIECDLSDITSLYGAPKKIIGNFNCRMNKLTTLEFAPEIVDGSFDCSKNRLKDLSFAPLLITGNFAATNMQMENLNCDSNMIIKKDFDVSYNKLTEIINFPKYIGNIVNIAHNKVEKLNRFNLGTSLIDKDNTYKYIQLEYKILQKNPNISDDELTIQLYILTNDVSLLSENLKDLFFI